MGQIELHKKIDKLLSSYPDNTTWEEIFAIISANMDACEYFFVNAGVRWLEWLWDNGFLDAIKKTSGDKLHLGGGRIPELEYLVRMSGDNPSKVVDIMLEIPVSSNNFNPEVVDRFLWICSELPAKHLARMVKKMQKEKWAALMGIYNQWGLAYEKMFQILANAHDFESILLLAEAILVVRTKEDLEKSKKSVLSASPFYFNDLSYTKAFENLVAIDNKYAEQTLGLVTNVLSQIIELGGENSNGEVFPKEDTLHFLDIDFFTLEVGQREHLSSRDDVRDLAAVVKVLSERTIGSESTSIEYAHTVYEKYFAQLPDNRSLWRLKLFVLSIKPEYFASELKDAFFRLFNVERYHEIISGTEYEKALRKGFHILPEEYQRKYVKQVIAYFSKRVQDYKDQDWHIQYGSNILSVIENHLTEAEKDEAEKAGFKLNPNYDPEPSIGRVRGGTVHPRAPISQEEFGKLPIGEIINKLCNEWTPQKLREQNTSDDFLNPLNAEGAGELLRADIPKRLQDYIDNAEQFFQRDVLDQHYTSSFLRGIQETVKSDKSKVSSIKWGNLFAFSLTIKESGEKKSFDSGRREREMYDAWLADWTGVHSAMTDVLQELLNDDPIIDFSHHREQLFQIISYLLSYPDPTPKDEELDTAAMKSGRSDGKMLVSDPFSLAINTVRGRAFQTFVLFVYQDGKKFSKDESIKISADVKKLYENVLDKENTRAIMFMFGHYIPSFYYRDINWIHGLLPKIFSAEDGKENLYIAAWEGYLAANLYEEIFTDPEFQKLYERGIVLEAYDSTRKHYKDPDEGIAVHLALAFMYYKEFGFEHPLFNAFWKNNDTEQHTGFVSFLGRSFVSGSNVSADNLLKKDSRVKQNLRDLWDYVLKNHDQPKLFVEMGFWISLEKDIFDSKWLADHTKRTLEKTKGILSWEYGLTKSIDQLAKDAPEDVLEIARLYILEGGVRGPNKRIQFHVEREWFDVFKILYSESATKSKTYDLIDTLIEEGGHAFWGLKEILNDKHVKE